MTPELWLAMSVALNLTLLLIGYPIAHIFVARRDSVILELREDLSKEKEKLRLLNILHPDPRCEDGWTFEYDDSTRFVGKYHKNGKGKMSVCEIRIQESWKNVADYYGYRIASLLNQGYVTASPEPGKNMEVAFKASDMTVGKMSVVKASDKKCSKCSKIVCLPPDPMRRSDTLYYSCGYKHWLNKPLQEVEMFARSIDCVDFEPKNEDIKKDIDKGISDI